MDDIKTPRFLAAFRGESLFVAPRKRPGDWREIPLGALDQWLAKQWRDRAMDSPASQPGALDETPAG